MTQWNARVAYAYWRDNPNVAAPTKRDLLDAMFFFFLSIGQRCNVSDQED